MTTTPSFKIVIPADGSDVLENIEHLISENERKVIRRIMTRDSVGSSSVLLEIIVEIINSKAACAAIAAVIIAWIKQKHGRKLTTQKSGETRTYENLTESELKRILQNEQVDRVSLEDRE
ncbi:hypothetical protein IG611_01550 [Pectobacterium sp. A535-S3-A17]|uniref:hypothetical protein n=1 Tax=Pectobacterium quasiaquaticum TaxID=2774015 RepID=UPI001877497F|nr:hypothetical protein [Pectobacterium quasiaquaticum]MBE5213277.1 hypothetical protein [Pectobacterium quasiaquaticum]MBE5224073.1 hypothetical protein [Pectobacterium quasiaquaticum]